MQAPKGTSTIVHWWSFNPWSTYQAVSCLILSSSHTNCLNKNWKTHGKTYKTKCEELGIPMHNSAQPEKEDTNSGPKDADIKSFMKPGPQAWSREGLLEHITELVVAEDEVHISGFLSFIRD